jgi:predicted lactoylglutathione lyase
MIGYITLGTNDLQKAAKFYDVLLAKCFKAKRDMESDRFVAWGTPENPGQFAVTKPFNNGPATVSNGGMVSLMLNSREEVDEFYTQAMELGASSEGAPGVREMEAFYGSYFRDLDGNKIAAFFFDKSMT